MIPHSANSDVKCGRGTESAKATRTGGRCGRNDLI